MRDVPPQDSRVQPTGGHGDMGGGEVRSDEAGARGCDVDGVDDTARRRAAGEVKETYHSGKKTYYSGKRDLS